MRILLAPILIAPLLLSLPAVAQGTQSVDQIINSLRPTGSLIQGGVRGIRAAPKPAHDNSGSSLNVSR